MTAVAFDGGGQTGEPYRPPVPMSVHVRGGVGASHVDSEELEVLEQAVDEAHDTLQHGIAQLGRARRVIEQQAAIGSVTVVTWAREVVEECHAGPQGALMLAEQVQELGDGLRHARYLYEEAELAAQPPSPPPSLLEQLNVLANPAVFLGQAAAGVVSPLAELGYSPVDLGLPSVPGLTAGPTPVGMARLADRDERLPPAGVAFDAAVRGLGEASQYAMPWSLLPGTFQLSGRPHDVADMTPPERFLLPASMAGSTLPMLLHGSQGVSVTEIGQRSVAPTTDLPGTVAAVGALRPDRGAPPGTIEVRRTEHRSGRRSWTVLLPSTQEMTPGGSNPVDNLTNVQTFSGIDSAVAIGAVQSMALAGIGPEDEVALVGHSQGGLSAMHVADHPVAQQLFDISTVVTAGSPVGHLPTPQGASTLHLEHLEDPIVGLDGTQNPAAGARTTVSRSLSTANGSRFGIMPRESHGLPTYVHTARLAQSDPSVAHVANRLQRVSGRSGDEVTAFTYQLRRE